MILLNSSLHAQNGLERVVVETYYVSDANDAVANPDGGVLPIGSVTYRIYADMLPGYEIQAVYGVTGHDCKIETSTLFFNNEDRGATSPTFSKTNAARNTVMLDSWLSMGAACNGSFGVFKSDDDGVATIVNNYSPQVLQNSDPLAGIPLSTQDGIVTVAGLTPESVTAVGISNEIAVFDNQNDGTNGPLFFTDNGSWAALVGASFNGTTGPLADTNRILIAQITTDGLLSFELNMQLGTPVVGAVENYVAKNPVGAEIQDSSLIYPGPSGVGFDEISGTSNSLFIVFPNPTTDVLKMKVIAEKPTANDSYTIYDITGKIMVAKKIGISSGNYFESVDLSKFAAGQYFLELSLNGKTTCKSVIKN